MISSGCEPQKRIWESTSFLGLILDAILPNSSGLVWCAAWYICQSGVFSSKPACEYTSCIRISASLALSKSFSDGAVSPEKTIFLCNVWKTNP